MIQKLLLAAGLAFAVAVPALAQNAAVVNGKAIPSARVDEIITEMKKQGQGDTPQLRSQVRDELIMREIFMQEAMKQKLTERPDIKLAIENARQRVILSALAQEYLKKNPISDADIQAEYEAAKARNTGTEYRARHILIAVKPDAPAADQDAAKKKAEGIIAKLKAGTKFEELAKQSDDTGSAANGGDLDWAPASNYVPEFAGALQALKKGETTEAPVKSQFGYHVIHLDDTRQAQFPPLEQVKQQVTEMLQQRKLGEYQKKLRDAAKVQ